MATSIKCVRFYKCYFKFPLRCCNEVVTHKQVFRYVGFWVPNQIGSDTITASLRDIYFSKYLGRYLANIFLLRSQHESISYTLIA
jgi:hypothetical protein